ncbi:MAG: MMPL family transporter, partial [Micromonospora sp.]
RWFVVAAWLVLLVGILAAARAWGGSFANDLTLAGTDSQFAYDTVRLKFPSLSGDGMQVVIHSEAGVAKPAVQRAVEEAVADVRGHPDVAAVQSPYGPAQRLVSADGQTAIVTVQFTQRAKDIDPESVARAMAAFDLLRDLGLQVEYGGPAVQAESGPSGSEVYGLIAAVVVLLVAFGSLFAMIVPIVTALMALGVGLAGITLLSNWVTIGTAGPVVAAMIGLGVGIDYALLVVTRHREGLSLGHDPAESISTAMVTAGRSVLVAGTTVIVAILSLYLIGIPFVSALGLASAVSVAATLLAAATLLPALLAIFGRRLDQLRIRRLRSDHGGGRETAWHRWTRRVVRLRWLALPIATLLLVLLALPLTALRLGTGDGGSQPAETTARRAYDLVAADFGPGWTGPLLVTADFGPNLSPAEVQRSGSELRTAILSADNVQQVTPPQVSQDGHTTIFTVIPSGSPDDESTEDLVHRLRSTVLPQAAPQAETHVGGATATNIDLADKLDQRMIWFMLLVVTLAYLVLLVEFRSLLVPLVAVAMNLLAVGAAYGPVVAVFQWGWWPAALIGASPGPVESFAPVMLFAVLFGLSTDYAVFLFSRIHEEFRRYGDARRAVVDGMAATSRVVLAAASVMVVVFASFVLNEQRTVKLFGFGLAIAIAMYALIATMVLAPALLAMLDRAAWWLPAWARRAPPAAHRELGHDPFEAELDAADIERGPRGSTTHE